MATESKTDKTQKAAKAPTAAYEVVSPLLHDGEAYAVGAEVELTTAQAEPLLGHTVKAKTAAA